MLTSIKTDITYKKLLKREFTTDQKNWFEESPGKQLNIKYKDIWAEDLPAFPPTASTSVIQKIDNFYLTKDLTVVDDRAWVYCSTRDNLQTRAGDFIEPDRDLSQAYFIKLFDSTNKQIFVGDKVDWSFDYANGILTFGVKPSTYTPPFRISGYRYVGVKGRNLSDDVTLLDQGYRGPLGDGAGRIITADLGPVQINATNTAPLQLTPVLNAPTVGLAGGQIIVKDGNMFVYDDGRKKWLAMNRQNLAFGAKRADGSFLNMNSFSSNMAGWPALRDGTILGITAQASSGYNEKQFTILKNNSNISLFEFNLSNYYYSNGNLDIDFSANDLIKILTSSRYPTTHGVIINIECSWRV